MLDGQAGTLSNFAEIANSVPYIRSPSSPVIPKYEGSDRKTANKNLPSFRVSNEMPDA
jgi:hypothetical protein